MKMSVSVQGVICARDNCRVNSNNTKMKADDKYFRAFIYDAVSRLKRNETIICFNKDQLNEINNRIPIISRYDKINNWWEVKKNENN